MPVLRGVVVSLVVGVVLTASPPRAWAEPPEAQVERLAADAVNAYRGADYNRAVELLQKAYEIRQVPALLYNMAKAYDKLGDVEHAEDAYRRYMTSLDADPKLKAKAEARVAVLDEQRRKNAAAERAVETPRPTPIATPARLPPTEPVHVAPQSVVIETHRAPAPRDDRKHARVVALALGITTVALGGVAIGLSVSALSLHNQWTSEFGGDEDTRRPIKNDALLRAGLADGFYALTAVSAAVTGYFLYRGFRAERAPSLAVSVSPAGSYIAALGRF